jgi:hypothetical protein
MMSNGGNQSVDRQMRRISRFLEKVVRPNEVTEVFIKDVERPGSDFRTNYTGYYDFEHAEQLGRDVLAYSGSARGIYYRINPVHPAVLVRCRNRLLPTRYVDSSKNVDIVTLRLLLIDIDPKRPKGICATDSEKNHADELAAAVSAYLHESHWPIPITCDSGNGYYLLYRIDLPSDDAHLVRQVLVALADKFNNEHAQIDVTVHDAARLARIPGTLNCKGDFTLDRPHRLCRVIRYPKGDLRVVPRELLEQLVAEAPGRSETGLAKATQAGNESDNTRKYVRAMAPAVSGQHGHDQTFKVACKLIIDFGLTTEKAWPIIEEYNQRCVPPWSEQDLRRKLDQAEQVASQRGMKRGALIHSNSDEFDKYLEHFRFECSEDLEF